MLYASLIEAAHGPDLVSQAADQLEIRDVCGPMHTGAWYDRPAALPEVALCEREHYLRPGFNSTRLVVPGLFVRGFHGEAAIRERGLPDHV